MKPLIPVISPNTPVYWVISSIFHGGWWLSPLSQRYWLHVKCLPSSLYLFLRLWSTVFALIFQPGLLCEIAGQGVEGIAALFKGGMGMLYGGTQLETGNAEINELISTRGMAGMMNTICWLSAPCVSEGRWQPEECSAVSLLSLYVLRKAGRNGVVHSCIGLVPESCYSRSIYIHYPDG